MIIFDFSVGLKQVKIKRRSLFLIFKKGDKNERVRLCNIKHISKKKKDF